MSGRLGKVCGLAVVAVFLAAAPARAGLVTPDSIPAPPPLSQAVDGAPVPPGGFVTDQYAGRGLTFPYRMTGVDTGLATALVRVNGVKVWAGATAIDGGLLGGVSFGTAVRADLAVPAAGSLRLRLEASGGTV